MNLHDLLGLDITASLDADGGLLLDTPKGVLTDNLIERIRQSKPFLIAELHAVATPKTHWLLHFPDRDPQEVVCHPEASHAEMLAWYPDTVAAEPSTPTIRQPSAPMSAAQESAIRAWLALIEETDPTTVADVIERCRQDVNAREYFTGRAVAELPKPSPLSDDRRTCEQCANLTGRRCQAAKRGEIVASSNHEPIRDLLRRCEGYEPGAADADRRPGRERWPELTDTKGTK